MNRVYPPVRGATGRVLKDLARTLAREGWHVTVITSGSRAGEERAEGVRIIWVKGPEKPKNIISYMWVWLKMFFVAMRLKPRHLLVTMTDPPLLATAGAFIAKYKKSRHINWCQDMYPEVMPALQMRIPNFLMRWFTALRRHAMNGCDVVVVNGRCMVKYLEDDGVDMQKIAMIPNWPDVELTDPQALEVTGTPYQHADETMVRPFDKQIKSDRRFRVLYAGNIGRVHTVETILNAAEILEKEQSDIEFVFVGKGQKFDRVAEQRAKRGIDNIRLLPPQPLSRLREMMESGDVHLISLKDKAEGFVVPSKLYSALAVARPCIFVGPKNCETAQVINDFQAGAVLANGDAKGLAQAITDLRQNSDLWIAAHQGAMQAREIYTPKAAMDAWMLCAWETVKDDLAA